jgi:hypothetical protein
MQSLGQELPSLGGTNKGSSRLISILELIRFDLNYGVIDSMNRKVIVTGFRIISGVVTGKYFSWKEGYLSALVSSWKVGSHEWKLSATIIVVAHACSYLIPQFLS